METVSLAGIVLGIALLILAVYRNFSVFLVAPIAAAVVGLVSRTDVIKLVLGPFSQGLSGFVGKFFVMFLVSSLFGRLMSDSGAANSIAYAMAAAVKKAKRNRELITILAATLLTAILTYAGVSVFVVIFTLVYIMRTLFKEMNVPWRLYAITTAGSVTFTMTMLPGAPSLQNIVPTKYLGTTPYAAPVVGSLSALLQVILIALYTAYVVARERKKHADEGFLPSGADVDRALAAEEKDQPRHPLWKCFLPPVVLLALMNGVRLAPELSVFCGVLACLVVFYPRFRGNAFRTSLSEGAAQSVVPIAATAVIVGLGAAIATLPGFGMVVRSLMKIPGPPLLSLAVGSNVAAGITASSSAGQSIFLETMGKHYLGLGIHPDLIHRIGAIASGGLDSLPHTGGIIVFLAVTRLAHRNSYSHMFWLTVVFPTLVSFFAVFLAAFGLR